MRIIDKINAEQLKSEVPEFGPGDTIRVHQLIQEGSKERVQVFEGVVLFRDGGGTNESFTVRKMSYNVGVERVFLLHSPKVSKIEVKQRGKVRRARLYYLRERQGKAAKIQEAHFSQADSAKKDTPKKESAAPKAAAAEKVAAQPAA